MNPTTNTMYTAYPKRLMQPCVPADNDRGLASWQELAGGFEPISLAEMDGVALLNRLDTKYVMTTRQLWDALTNLQQDYWMLEVEGLRLNRYRTLYFDTPDFALYHAHVNKRPERYKVRSREYADSHLAFLEVKHRTRKDRTIKDRVRTPEQVIAMTAAMTDWLGSVSPVDGSTLEPKLWNSFLRMTLVNKQCCERVTLDLGLAFATDTRRLQLDGIAIAEVKMDGLSGASPFMLQMRAQRIHPRGFSKYAVGVALLYDGVKKNTLKPRLIWVEKMMKGMISDVRA